MNHDPAEIVLVPVVVLPDDRRDFLRRPAQGRIKAAADVGMIADRPAIDLLFGGDRERLALEAGRSAAAITRDWEAEEDEFRRRRRPFLLY